MTKGLRFVFGVTGMLICGAVIYVVLYLLASWILALLGLGV